MMEIKCVDCGAMAMSKCPACRSIFPREEYLAMLRSQISFEETKPTGEGKYFRRELIIKIDMYENESMEDCLRRLFTTGRDILNQEENPESEEEKITESAYISKRSFRLPTVKKLLCDHRWAPADENQHSSIGCGHY